MLVQLMNYTQMADARIIAILQNNKPIPEKAISLFNHVLNAQHIWASRILNQPSLYAVWEEHSTQALSSVSIGNFERFKHILENLDVTKEVAYTNSKGDRFTNEIRDILIHAFNHSTYHRGQIASLLKANGLEPPVTDYIMLKREMYL